MMRAWFSAAEIAAAGKGDLPNTVRGLNLLIERDGWRLDAARSRKTGGRGGGWEYHVSLLPKPVQVRLGAGSATSHSGAPPSVGSADISPACGEIKSDIWARFERLPQKHKDEAQARLQALELVRELRENGSSDTGALRAAARTSGVSPATLYNWRRVVDGIARADWLAVLAPGYKGGAGRAACEDKAYAMVKSDFLRPEKPSLSSCIRRVRAVAKKEGWAMPSERSLRRHLDADVPKPVQRLARSGRDSAKALYPAQTRSRAHFHAMQAVNMDGHKFDVFVKMPDGRVTRVFLVGLQDLHSGKIVAWRLSESENKETVRLAIGDMVEAFGIPEEIWLDNGRAFASKWISGGSATRYRFKVREEDPQGLLTALNIKIHWTTPYSGQSKPIERAWRDLADVISRHPACAGAYTGNKPDAKPENYGSRAITLEDFRALCAREIAGHNAQAGRSMAACKGRSFDETFEASLNDPSTIVRWPSHAQKALWLMAAERIRTAKGNGEINFMGNRYWSGALTGHARKMVTVRFDPDALQEPLRVYDESDRFLCAAPCIAATGFKNQDAARDHGRKRRAYVNALASVKDMHATLSADELARIYASGAESAPVKGPQKTKVTRLATAGQPPVLTPEPEWDEEDEQAFSRGLRMIMGGKPHAA